MANDNSPSAHKEPTDTTTDATLERTTFGSADAAGWLNPGTVSGDTTVEIDATRDRRGASEIELRTAVRGSEVSLFLDAEAADALASKLRAAVAFVEGEDR
jgi:hypothetical protein